MKKSRKIVSFYAGGRTWAVGDEVVKGNPRVERIVIRSLGGVPPREVVIVRLDDDDCYFFELDECDIVWEDE